MNDIHSPDEELVSRAVTGDEDALTTLLRRHGPALRGKIAPTIGAKWQNVLDADDILQVTYLEVFLRIERFVPQGPGAFVAWLGRIAKNNLRDAIKELERLKRPHPDRREEPGGGDESVFALLEQLGHTTTTASRHAVRGEVRLAVEAALQNLPQDYACVVRQYDLEERSAAEVAQAMGRSTGAVYMLRARAHDRLRESFGPESRLFSRRS